MAYQKSPYSELAWLTAALMGEAGPNDNAASMGALADVIMNRVNGTQAPNTAYGSSFTYAPNTVAGQISAYSGGSPQFSSYDRNQSLKEGNGSASANQMLMAALQKGASAFSGAALAKYNQAREVAATFLDQANPNYGRYSGSSGGSDFFVAKNYPTYLRSSGRYDSQTVGNSDFFKLKSNGGFTPWADPGDRGINSALPMPGSDGVGADYNVSGGVPNGSLGANGGTPPYLGPNLGYDSSGSAPGTIGDPNFGAGITPNAYLPMPANYGAIAAMYQHDVGRSPDASGLNYWGKELTSGKSLFDVEQAIRGSAEGQAYLSKNPRDQLVAMLTPTLNTGTQINPVGPGSDQLPFTPGWMDMPIGPDGFTVSPIGPPGLSGTIGPNQTQYPLGPGSTTSPIGPDGTSYPVGPGGISGTIGPGSTQSPVGPGGFEVSPVGPGAEQSPVGPGPAQYPVGPGSTQYPVGPDGFEIGTVPPGSATGLVPAPSAQGAINTGAEVRPVGPEGFEVGTVPPPAETRPVQPTFSQAFDGNAYLAANQDVKAAGMDPLQHFLRFGYGEGRAVDTAGDRLPQGFDSTAYLAQNQDVARSGMGGLEHYLRFGAAEGRAAPTLGNYGFSGANVSQGLGPIGNGTFSGKFNAADYLAANQDVARSGMNAEDHYLRFGFGEGRALDTAGHRLSQGFDGTAYLAANKDVALAGMDPLRHFIESGASEGRAMPTGSNPYSFSNFNASQGAGPTGNGAFGIGGITSSAPGGMGSAPANSSPLPAFGSNLNVSGGVGNGSFGIGGFAQTDAPPGGFEASWESGSQGALPGSGGAGGSAWEYTDRTTGEKKTATFDPQKSENAYLAGQVAQNQSQIEAGRASVANNPNLWNFGATNLLNSVAASNYQPGPIYSTATGATAALPSPVGPAFNSPLPVLNQGLQVNPYGGFGLISAF